ncbi:MAG: helix-turn-helix transcriptional regulator [Ruminococcaceae bacterium]|nr:helix-turn-helix transcriptional regulator [Oscillospiraceae bacterium]
MPEIAALAEYTLEDRHRRGETQFTYAGHCGISTEFLSLIERGKANPSLGTIQKIAAYIGVPVSEMLEIPQDAEA